MRKLQRKTPIPFQFIEKHARYVSTINDDKLAFADICNLHSKREQSTSRNVPTDSDVNAASLLFLSRINGALPSFCVNYQDRERLPDVYCQVHLLGQIAREWENGVGRREK